LISDIGPDCVVVSSYDRILSPPLIDICPFVNVHYAPLPRYRGRAPVNWAIIQGEPTAAISIHLVDDGLDSGNLLFQEEIALTDADTATTVYERLNRIQEQRLGETVIRLVSGWRGMAQNPEMATYGCARTPADGMIQWCQSAREIDRLVRALTAPFPGAFTFLRGRRLIVHKAGLVERLPRYTGVVPGRVIRRSGTGGWVDVLTGDGALRLVEVEFDGELPAPAAAVIRSTRDTLGLHPSDLIGRIVELEMRLARLDAAFGSAKVGGVATGFSTTEATVCERFEPTRS
jgi:methionyl-tRNA formyltransferase